MADIYKNWHQADSIKRFAKKSAEEFFRSETYFLDKIGPEISSVLDIGCASGRFIDLIRKYNKECRYTGIDLVPESIEIGRQFYPDADFHVMSGLDFVTAEQFDLVNATGVFQHEPRYQQLFQNMFGWSSRYILFDIKVSGINDHLIDISRAYCQKNNDRMHFNVLSWPLFRKQMLSLDGVESITVFAYETKPNKVTVVPEEVLPFASMGVLIKKGTGDSKFIETSVPDFLL